MSTRLAVVVDTFPRWSERFVARELQELRRRGVDFTVFALRRGEPPAGEDHDFAGLYERLRIFPALPSPTNVTAILKALPTLRTKAARERLLLCQKELGPLTTLRLSRAHVLEQWLREGAYTHVHAHFASLPSTLAWIASVDAQLPFTFSAHARDLFVEAQLLDEKAREARAVFVCHRAAHRRIEAIPGIGRRAVFMPHGLPLEHFEARQTDPPAGHDGRSLLLAAGRMVTKKGFDVLVKAMALEQMEPIPARLEIVGDGPEHERLESLVAQRGLGDRVRLRPPESGAALNACMREAAAFVLPSRSEDDGDRDGVPNALLEAMSLGVPVVGTAAGGLPQVLDARTGYVAREGDASDLAMQLSACLADPEAARARAATARERVAAEYDIRKNIEPLLRVLGVL